MPHQYIRVAQADCKLLQLADLERCGEEDELCACHVGSIAYDRAAGQFLAIHEITGLEALDVHQRLDIR